MPQFSSYMMTDDNTTLDLLTSNTKGASVSETFHGNFVGRIMKTDTRCYNNGEGRDDANRYGARSPYYFGSVLSQSTEVTTCELSIANSEY